MGKTKLHIKPITIGRTRVTHPSSSKADGTIPGYLVQCHQCGAHFGVCVGNYNRGRGLFCTQDCDRLYRLRGPEERFWSMVEKADACWLWTGYTMSSGHGQMYHPDGTMLVHRFSWELHNGPIPEGLVVCHKCDVPNCVNPSHLFLGTQSDNVQDAVNKGRLQHGETNGHSKLKVDDVLSIIRLRKSGLTEPQIASQFGVSRGAINSILRNKTWKHIPRN